MTTPYVGFSNESLDKQPALKAGDEVDCHICKGKHAVVDSNPPMLLTFNCRGNTYLAGLNGKSIVNAPTDASGELG